MIDQAAYVVGFETVWMDKFIAFHLARNKNYSLRLLCFLAERTPGCLGATQSAEIEYSVCCKHLTSQCPSDRWSYNPITPSQVILWLFVQCPETLMQLNNTLFPRNLESIFKPHKQNCHPAISSYSSIQTLCYAVILPGASHLSYINEENSTLLCAL